MSDSQLGLSFIHCVLVAGQEDAMINRNPFIHRCSLDDPDLQRAVRPIRACVLCGMRRNRKGQLNRKMWEKVRFDHLKLIYLPFHCRLHHQERSPPFFSDLLFQEKR